MSNLSNLWGFALAVASALSRLVSVAAVAACAVACASTGVVLHEFEFRPLQDSPDVKVLSWAYSSTHSQGWETERALAGDVGVAGQAIRAAMPVGNTIFVQWLDKSTGVVQSRSIDLEGRLPRSMADKRIYMRIEGGAPQVFVLSRDGATPEYLKWRNRVFPFKRIEQVYP